MYRSLVTGLLYLEKMTGICVYNCIHSIPPIPIWFLATLLFLPFLIPSTNAPCHLFWLWVIQLISPTDLEYVLCYELRILVYKGKYGSHDANNKLPSTTSISQSCFRDRLGTFL